jgi:hypothetical protein
MRIFHVVVGFITSVKRKRIIAVAIPITTASTIDWMNVILFTNKINLYSL